MDTRSIPDSQAPVLLAVVLEQIREEIPLFFAAGPPSAGTVADLSTLLGVISQREMEAALHACSEESLTFRQLSIIRDAYRQYLSSRHFLDTPALIEWTITALGSGIGPAYETVRMIHIPEPAPRERRLIRAITSRSATFRWESPPGGDRDLFSLPDGIPPGDRVILPGLPESAGRAALFTSAPVNPDDRIRTAIFSTPLDEYEAIAEEIYHLVSEGHNPGEIVIAYPDITTVLSPITEVLDDFGIPWQADAGEPLAREPVITFLLLFLSLVIDQWPREGVIALLGSPYFKIRQPDLPACPLSRFDLICREAGIEGGFGWEEQLSRLQAFSGGDAGETPRFSDDEISRVMTWIRELQEDIGRLSGNHVPSDLAGIVNQVIERWTIPEIRHPAGSDPLHGREYQAVRLFLAALGEITSILPPGEPVSPARYRRILSGLLEEPVRLSHVGGGVRLMGLRQTVGLDIPVLFLAGLVEGDIPHPSTRLPLLTSRESELLGSRSLDEVLREEKYYFLSALLAGRDLFLSAPASRDERTCLSSSFFERARTRLCATGFERTITRSSREAAIRAGRLLAGRNRPGDERDPLDWLSASQEYTHVATRILVEEWYRTGDPETAYDGILAGDDGIISWLNQPGQFGADTIWSPTNLEMYATCPFRFFMERVCRISPLPEVDPTLSPARKGTLVHDTLCSFYQSWTATGPRRIQMPDIEEATALLTAIGEENSGRYPYDSPAWHATLASLQGLPSLPGLYERFIRYEAGKNGPLVPSLFEVPIGEPDGITLDTGEDEPIRIRGRIDRVDIAPGGGFAIIDYKTGSTYPNWQRIIEGKALQLPLYLLALEQEHAGDSQPLTGIGGSYLQVRQEIKQAWSLLDPERKEIAGVSSRTQGTDGFREVTSGALAAAGRYISGIRGGIFPVTRDPCKETFCPYAGICRYDRFRQGEAGGEEEA